MNLWRRAPVRTLLLLKLGLSLAGGLWSTMDKHYAHEAPGSARRAQEKRTVCVSAATPDTTLASAPSGDGRGVGKSAWTALDPAEVFGLNEEQLGLLTSLQLVTLAAAQGLLADVVTGRQLHFVRRGSACGCVRVRELTLCCSQLRQESHRWLTQPSSAF